MPGGLVSIHLQECSQDIGWITRGLRRISDLYRHHTIGYGHTGGELCNLDIRILGTGRPGAQHAARNRPIARQRLPRHCIQRDVIDTDVTLEPVIDVAIDLLDGRHCVRVARHQQVMREERCEDEQGGEPTYVADHGLPSPCAVAVASSMPRSGTGATCPAAVSPPSTPRSTMTSMIEKPIPETLIANLEGL